VDAYSSAGDGSPNASGAVWSSEWWKLALAGTALTADLFFSGPALPPPAPDHPLPPCSVPTNCERTSSAYDVPTETLFAATRHALDRLAPIAHRRASDSLRASAVYRVGGIFKDDVTAVVLPNSDASTLHLRSSSRIGLYDLEVNRRRVRNLLDAVEQELSTTGAQTQ